MSEIWNKVYRSDASFFADGPSNFALDCYEEFKKHEVERILEKGKNTSAKSKNDIRSVYACRRSRKFDSEGMKHSTYSFPNSARDAHIFDT